MLEIHNSENHLYEKITIHKLNPLITFLQIKYHIMNQQPKQITKKCWCIFTLPGETINLREEPATETRRMKRATGGCSLETLEGSGKR